MDRPRTTRATVARGAPAWLAALLAAIAYRPLLWPGQAPGGLGEVLFLTGAVPPQLPLGIAAWIAWLRVSRLAHGTQPGAPLAALPLAALGAGLFAWAQLTGAPSLLIPSLAAIGLGAGVALRGAAGLRMGSVPALALLLGMPVPKPLYDEVVWQLQLASASAAGWLLDVVGRDFVQLGVVLRDATHFFHVIDGCSGINGIVILTLVALLVRELFGGGGWRSWLAVAAAPPLGFAVNAVRVAYIAASANSAIAEGDHVGQGLAVLMGGTALLYGLAWALAPASPISREDHGAPAPTRGVYAGLVALCALLLVLSFAVPRFPEARQQVRIPPLAFPVEKGEWTSERAPANALFRGYLAGGAQRRYHIQESEQRSAEVVDFLVGYEQTGPGPTFRLLSSKLSSPGPGWNVDSRETHRLWVLDRDVVLAHVSRGEERGLTYAWKPRDRGLWRETWRDLLALEASPFRRETPRAAVRLFAYAPHGGPLALARARQRLDRFVADFHEELDAL